MDATQPVTAEGTSVNVGGFAFAAQLILFSILTWYFFAWQSFGIDILYDSNDLVFRQSDVGNNLLVRDDVRRWSVDSRNGSLACEQLSHVFLFDEPTYVRFLSKDGLLLERRSFTRDERILAAKYPLRSKFDSCVNSAADHFETRHSGATNIGNGVDGFLVTKAFSYSFFVIGEESVQSSCSNESVIPSRDRNTASNFDYRCDDVGRIGVRISFGVVAAFDPNNGRADGRAGDEKIGSGGVDHTFLLSPTIRCAVDTRVGGYTVDVLSEARRADSPKSSLAGASVGRGDNSAQNPCLASINAATVHRWGYFPCTYGQYCAYHLAGLRKPRDSVESAKVLEDFYWACLPDENESLNGNGGSAKNQYGSGGSFPLDLVVPSLRLCPSGQTFDGYYCSSAALSSDK